MDFLIPLGIGLIVGLIVLFSLLSQLKTVVQKHEASDYITPNSLKLTHRDDRFVTKHTDRQMIRQAPAPGGMSAGAPGAPHQSMPGGPKPQNGPSAAPGSQHGGGLHIVDTPKHGK